MSSVLRSFVNATCGTSTNAPDLDGTGRAVLRKLL
jgi:hypothetical protein